MTEALQGSRLGAPDLRISREPRLLRDEVVDKLRQAIIQGWYAPGARLIERELCEALGVSRTSVREALRQLEAEQLVRVEPRRGPVVAEIGLAAADEIYELRRVIETAVVRWFIERAGEDALQRLRHHFSEFRSAATAGDLNNLVGSMSDFYQTLFEGAANSIVHDIARQLMARISYLRARSMSEPGRITFSVAEIAAILDAIERREIEEAQAAVAVHIENAAEAAKRQVKRS